MIIKEPKSKKGNFSIELKDASWIFENLSTRDKAFLTIKGNELEYKEDLDILIFSLYLQRENISIKDMIRVMMILLSKQYKGNAKEIKKDFNAILDDYQTYKIDNTSTIPLSYQKFNANQENILLLGNILEDNEDKEFQSSIELIEKTANVDLKKGLPKIELDKPKKEQNKEKENEKKTITEQEKEIVKDTQEKLKASKDNHNLKDINIDDILDEATISSFLNSDNEALKTAFKLLNSIKMPLKQTEENNLDIEVTDEMIQEINFYLKAILYATITNIKLFKSGSLDEFYKKSIQLIDDEVNDNEN